MSLKQESLSSGVFIDAPEGAEFWVGRTSHMGQVEYPQEDSEANYFLNNQYRRAGIIGGDDPQLISQDGLSSLSQGNSGRSSRFVVLEKGQKDDDIGSPRIVATLSTIYRSADDLLHLPIEDIFHHLFNDRSDTVNSVEITRTASCHPDDVVQHLAFLAMVRASFGQAIELGASKVYIQTEPFVVKLLEKTKVPHSVIGPPQLVQEFRQEPTILLPVECEIDTVLEDRKADQLDPMIKLYLEDIEFHRGLGFFSPDLIKPL